MSEEDKVEKKQKMVKEKSYQDTQELMGKCRQMFRDYLYADQELSRKERLLVVSRACNGLIAISYNTIREHMYEFDMFIQEKAKEK